MSAGPRRAAPTLCTDTSRLFLVKYFLISAPVDWQPDQYIRRFLLPTGEYVSCVLWCVTSRGEEKRVHVVAGLTAVQEQPLSHLGHRHRAVSLVPVPGLRSAC